MELEKQVSNKELSKKLNELGVKQDSVFYWTDDGKGNEWYVVPEDQEHWDSYYTTKCKISAFTVAELWSDTYYTETTNYVSDNDRWVCKNRGGYNHYEWADTEANARAKMKIYMIKNGIIKVN